MIKNILPNITAMFYPSFLSIIVAFFVVIIYLIYMTSQSYVGSWSDTDGNVFVVKKTGTLEYSVDNSNSSTYKAYFILGSLRINTGTKVLWGMYNSQTKRIIWSDIPAWQKV